MTTPMDPPVCAHTAAELIRGQGIVPIEIRIAGQGWLLTQVPLEDWRAALVARLRAVADSEEKEIGGTLPPGLAEFVGTDQR